MKNIKSLLMLMALLLPLLVAGCAGKNTGGDSMAGHDMGPEYVSAFLRDLGITYPVTLGPQRPLDGLAGQVRGIPTSFLLDRDGQLIRRVEGLFPENALRTAVRKLLTEDPPKTPRIDHVG